MRPPLQIRDILAQYMPLTPGDEADARELTRHARSVAPSGPTYAPKWGAGSQSQEVQPFGEL